MITALDKNTALILIDLQNSVAALTLAHPVKDVLCNAAKLVAAFRKAGLPIVIVNVNSSGTAWTSSRKDAVSPQRPTVDNPLGIVPEIETQAGDIFITKHTWGAFYETALDEELKKRNITGIVLAGIATSIGVEGTARAASERAYNITFALDAMTDMFMDAHEHSVKRIFPRIGETGMTEDVIKLVSGE
jgi:nicotinamidase-related amidase